MLRSETIMTLVFKEPETFQTPDGGEYVILPVQVDDMPVLFNIIDKRARASKKTKKNKKDEDTGQEFIKACGTDLQELIGKTVINIKTGEPLPLKYRNPGNMIELMGKIMKITMPNSSKESEGEDTPLEQ